MSNTTTPDIRFACGVEPFDRVYELAVDTLSSNIKPWKDGLLDVEALAIMAGETYTRPWTRDCAFNVWNAGALLVPEAARNTLVSTLVRDGDVVRIGGQYWDAISWVTGAWHYYCVTGDRKFLELAYEAAVNSLAYFEETEFDAETGLFEGAASYGDGVAAYPEPYNQAGGSSGILDWPAANPQVGRIRMKALSTNCLYFNAYKIADLMADRIGGSGADREQFRGKAAAVRDAINRHLWLPDKGRYAYFVDHEGRCEEYQEGLGHALAILTGVADDEQARSVLASQYVSIRGIPCIWPLFPRFRSADGMSFGRHNGTVWPFIQGFWADAAARCRQVDLFDHELAALAEMADRHHEFKEIYHPVTGEPYGGLQVDKGEMRLWPSEPNQTWSATGYLRMIHLGLAGMRFEPDALRFEPMLPERFEQVRLGPIPYRNMTLDVTVRGPGTRIDRFTLDGDTADPVIYASLTGQHEIEITMR